MINVDVECKNCHVCERDYVWTPSICSCENWKNLNSIENESAIICDGVIDSYEKETKTISTNFNESYSIIDSC